MSPTSHLFHFGCKITELTLLSYDQLNEKEAINPLKGPPSLVIIIFEYLKPPGETALNSFEYKVNYF